MMDINEEYIEQAKLERLRTVAQEFNMVMGFDPPINLDSNQEELIEELIDNADQIRPNDRFNNDVWDFITNAFGIEPESYDEEDDDEEDEPEPEPKPVAKKRTSKKEKASMKHVEAEMEPAVEEPEPDQDEAEPDDDLDEDDIEPEDEPEDVDEDEPEDEPEEDNTPSDAGKHVADHLKENARTIKKNSKRAKKKRCPSRAECFCQVIMEMKSGEFITMLELADLVNKKYVAGGGKNKIATTLHNCRLFSVLTDHLGITHRTKGHRIAKS